MIEPMFPRFIGALVVAALLSGCADAISDLDFDFRGNGVSDVAVASRPEPDANGLITYPTYQVAVARQGDTVADVASRTGIPAEELASFNGRTSGDRLREGEILAMPRIVAPGTGGAAATDITAIASAAIDAADTGTGTQVAGVRIQPGAEPVRHRVARGETAYSVARLYDVPVRSLAEWNGLGPDLEVREGQYLIIPLAVPQDEPSEPVSAAPPGETTAPAPPSAAEPLPESIETATLPSAPDLSDNSEPAPPPEPEPEPEPEPAAESELQRPVAGAVLRGFSSSNEGVDIAAATGTAVRAAEDGEVAAITQDTDQIPILVIRHSGNLLTVYANIQNIRVERGDRVERGEVVADVGPGDPSFLHFEVRRGFEAVDPLPFIE